MQNGKLLPYYTSAINHDIVIAFFVGILFFGLRDGIFTIDIQEGGDTVTSFDGFILILIISSLLLGSLLFLFIFTRLSDTGIRVLYTVALGLPMLLFLYEIITLQFAAINNILDLMFTVTSILILSVFFAYFLFIYVTGRVNLRIRNLGVTLSAVIIGRIMSIFFDLPSIVLFAVILSLFDIYSVFRGPLSKVLGKPKRVNLVEVQQLSSEQLRSVARSVCKKGTPVILSKQNTMLGIGDVLFFAILLYKSLQVWGVFGFGVTAIAIMIGTLFTMFLLRRISPLPGLPLPVLLVLTGYAILYVIYGG